MLNRQGPDNPIILPPRVSLCLDPVFFLGGVTVSTVEAED